MGCIKSLKKRTNELNNIQINDSKSKKIQIF